MLSKTFWKNKQWKGWTKCS